MENEDKFDVAIIGGGPAGMMAAAAAAEAGAKVILIEKNRQLGRKLLLTGSGRCNITNAEFNLTKLVTNYGKNGKFLFHAFSFFGPKETIDFFNNLGIKTKIEKNNRVFPLTENAEDVLGALKSYLLRNDVHFCLGTEITKIVTSGNIIEKLLIGKKEIVAQNYILCTGGKSYSRTGSTGDGFKWAKELGHGVSDLRPALVPIILKEKWDLQGLSLYDIEISAHNIKETGDIIFTHFGISGPATLNISKKIGELLKNGEVKILLDLLPNETTEVLEKRLKETIQMNPKRLLKRLLSDFIPQRLTTVFPNINKKAGTLSKKEIRDTVKLLKALEVTATGLQGFDFSMVTSGGILTNGIDDKNMRSKKIHNLFFAGEIIDVDGKSGGFNLQECWSTGYLAGKKAAKI